VSADAAADAERIIGAIRNGHVYSVIDALASPGSLTFSATSGSQTARTGDSLAIEGDVMLHASPSAPPGTTLVLLRDGRRVHEVTDGPLVVNGGQAPAAYRVEAYTANPPGGPPVPWIVSNPIYVGNVTAPPLPRMAEPLSRIPARIGETAAESGVRDTSVVTVGGQSEARVRAFSGDPAINWQFALSAGAPAGQFAAAAVPVSDGLAAFDRVRFRASAAAPMRVWVQLRAPVGNTERWGRTFYVDTEPRIIDIALASFAPIGVTSSAQAPLDRVRSLLFVVDTLNTLPGRSGNLTISEVAFVK
jgi:hypothetical protein